MSRHRRRTVPLALVALAASVVTVVNPLARPPSAAATTPWEVPGAGATVPFTQLEAEGPQASTNGSVIGPDYTQGSVASEASGRRAVQLSGQGQFVEFRLTAPANALTLAYNLPQGAGGRISYYLNGTKASQGFALSSRFMYLDTSFIGGSKIHHLFTHDRLMFGQSLGTGATVRLQVDAGDVSGAVIDTADFENVGPAATQPAGSISVTTRGADPSGGADSTAAFNQTIAAARAAGQSVWIPQGDFRITSPLQIDAVTMRGAGPWYSVLRGTHLIDNGSSAGPIRLFDFAAIGEVTVRNDGSPDNFVNGSLGVGSTVSNIWIQHQKVGLWLVGPNNTNLTIENNRIIDTTADGVNFNGTVTNSVVRNNYLRNNGDDALAMWSLHSQNSQNTFTHNTIVQPNLANGIGIYGGRDTTLSANVIADTNALGSGIAISNQEFVTGQGFTPLAGTIAVSDNVIIRGGAFNPNWGHPMSAIRVDAFNYPISTGVSVSITGGQILESPFSAIQVVGGDGTGKTVTSLSVDRVTVRDVGTVVLQAEVQGSGSFSNITASGVGVAGIYNCSFPPGTPNYSVNLGAGNTGWQNSVWPSCTFPTPGQAQPLTLTPGSLAFGTQNVGTTSQGQPVTVRNPGSSAVTLQSITTGGDFARTTTCGSSLAAGASCSATVTFTPTAAGNRTGTLTVNSGAGPSTATLTGRGFDPNGNLAAGQPVAETSHTQNFVAANAVDGNADSYWESANNAFPQSVTVDLGASASVSRVVLKLPPSAVWQSRTQTLSVSGSADGQSFSTVVGSAGYTFNPASGNTATITFAATSARFVRLTFTANTGWPAAQLSEFEVYGSGGGQPPPPPPNQNLAAGRPTTETSHTQALGSGNAVDGNADSYWESANNAFPQSVTVDLGASMSVSRVVLKLPPSAVWQSRTQTLSVSGSADGQSFSTVVGSAGYTFNPASGNTATITFTATSRRFLRLTVTANTGWPAGQVSEFEVYAS